MRDKYVGVNFLWCIFAAAFKERGKRVVLSGAEERGNRVKKDICSDVISSYFCRPDIKKGV